jgi:tetratricopeptide (TPR) repeat protein
VRLADGERAIDEIARDRRAPFSGKLFRDHVHLTFDGNYLLAEAILAQLEQALPEEIRHRANGNLPTRAECAVWLALTPYDELQMSAWAANTMSRPPFTQQLDHDDRQADAREQVENLRRAASAEETFEEAMKTYATALARSPNDWQIHDHLAAILLRRGKVAEAVEHWREAVRLLPTNIDTLHQLATVLATSPIASVRNGPEAVGLAERAVMLAGGGEPMFLDTLAAAHAEAGNLAKAIETARQAIALASRQQKQSLIATLQAKIADYERRARRASQPQR